MTIADYILIGLCIIAIVVGLIKGFAKMLLNGILSFIVTITLSYFIVSFLSGLIYGSALGGKLQSSILDSINSKDYYAQELILNEEEKKFYVVDEGELVKLDESFAKYVGKGGFFVKIGVNILVKNINTDDFIIGTTISELLAPAITVAIIKACLFLISFIVLLILLSMLRALFDRITENSTVNGVDRFLGAVAAVCIVLAPIMIGLYFINAYALNIEFIMNVIYDSKLLSFLFDIIK